MTGLLIASDLELATDDAAETGYYHAVDFSQPIAMLDASRLKVSGVIQQITGSDFQMVAIVEVSNDLSTWHAEFVEYALLVRGSEPHVFMVGVVAGAVIIAHAYARVKWALYPSGKEVLEPDQRVLFTAHAAIGQ